jgi:2-C-methyl-D-erythritol 2,4-cyclodiphosphate synthase
MRIGHGFDIHRLIEGTPLVIGGVTILHTLGADAHSDGDAMYHSIVDSILGALTLPDIGQLVSNEQSCIALSSHRLTCAVVP